MCVWVCVCLRVTCHALSTPLPSGTQIPLSYGTTCQSQSQFDLRLSLDILFATISGLVFVPRPCPAGVWQHRDLNRASNKPPYITQFVAALMDPLQLATQPVALKLLNDQLNPIHLRMGRNKANDLPLPLPSL